MNYGQLAQSSSAPNNLPNNVTYGHFPGSNARYPISPPPPQPSHRDPFGLNNFAPETADFTSSASTMSTGSSFPYGEPQSQRQLVTEQQLHISKLTTQVEGLQHTVEEQRLKEKFKMPLQQEAPSKEDNQKKLSIRHQSQAFAFSHGLWLGALPATIANTRLPSPYDLQTRLSPPSPDSGLTVQTNDLYGLIWELTEHLPTESRVWLQSEQTMKQIKKSMAEFRSYFQHEARQNAAKLLSEFSDVTADNLNNIGSTEERSGCQVFQDLLGCTAATPSTLASYSQISPLISRNGNPQLDDIFRAGIISKVLVMILAGPNQVGKATVQLTSKCHAKLWGIKTVTPGMIANAAIMAEWMISPDESFHPKGVQSGLDYFQRFKFYKSFIIANKATLAMNSLISDLNAVIFGIAQPMHTPTTPAPQSLTPSVDASVERLVQSVRAAPTIYESQDGDTDGTEEFAYGLHLSSTDSLPAADIPWASSRPAFGTPWMSSTDSLPGPNISSSSVESLPDVESFLPAQRSNPRPAAGLPPPGPPAVVPPPAPPRTESTGQHTPSDIVVPEPVPAPRLVAAGPLSQRLRRNGNQEVNHPNYVESESEEENTGKRKRASKPAAARKRGGGAGRGAGKQAARRGT